jgi:hypothetical protein
MTVYTQSNHPKESYEAAQDSVSQAKNDEALCYHLISEAPNGMTADEISAHVEASQERIFPPNQVNSRLFTLRKDGKIVRSIVKRQTRRNRNAAVHFDAAIPWASLVAAKDKVVDGSCDVQDCQCRCHPRPEGTPRP